jgi:hypothetical protein
LPEFVQSLSISVQWLYPSEGYVVMELRKLVPRFFDERGRFLEKYGERNFNSFIAKTLNNVLVHD